MDREFFDRSSDLRELLEEDTDLSGIELESDSDIEAEDVPSDVSLEDFSSGSGEEYVPNLDELDTSEVDEPDLGLVQGTSRNVVSDNSSDDDQPDLGNRPIPLLPPPPKPAWIRVYPPETPKDVESAFTARTTGPKNQPLRNSSPLTYFSLFFTTNVLNHIVRHTNYYAQNKIGEKRNSGEEKRFSRWKKWVDVTYLEIKKYLALIINMGLTRRKNMAHYWDQRPSQVIPFFSRTMSVNRFLLVNSFLHLTLARPIGKGQPGYDPWQKVRYLFDHLNATFKKYFVCSQNVSIDESMIGMKNRCTFIQYMPNKKHARYGIKKFEVCDSRTGYIMHVEMYSGNDFMAEDPSPFTEKVILHTLQKSNLLDKFHHVFTDQFYTKFPVAKKLFNRKTYLTGTINKKSKFLSKTVMNTKLGARESIYFRKEEALLVGFRQKLTRKPVYLLTTACHAEDIHVRSKKGLEGIKPLVIHKYNQYMGGVDVSDQSIYHTSCSRQTSKYWKKIFFNFLDMSMFNAFVLYKHNTDRPLSRRDFIISVLESLASDDVPAPLPIGPAGDPGAGHNIAHLPGSRLRLCLVCETKGNKKRSRFWCPGCNCGIHRECFPYLQHFWRPMKTGRKRKNTDGDSDSE